MSALFFILGALMAIALYGMRRAERRVIEQTGYKPVPPDIFQRVWDEDALLIEIYYDAMERDDMLGARDAILHLEKEKGLDYHQFISSANRALALIDIQRSHPGLLAEWTQKSDGPVREYHPAVLITAATMPLPYYRFDRSKFFASVRQTAQQMERENATS